MNESMAMLELADAYEAGLQKCAASGYEEYGPDFERRQRLVIDALRFTARSSAPQEDGRALEGMPKTLGDVFPVSEMVDRLERRGAELNATAVTPNGQLMLKAAFYLKALSLEAGRLDWLQGRVVDTIYLDDGKIIDVRGNSVRDAIDDAMKRWPGSLEDESGDAQQEAALTRPQPGGAVAGTERGGIDG